MCLINPLPCALIDGLQELVAHLARALPHAKVIDMLPESYELMVSEGGQPGGRTDRTQIRAFPLLLTLRGSLSQLFVVTACLQDQLNIIGNTSVFLSPSGGGWCARCALIASLLICLSLWALHSGAGCALQD